MCQNDASDESATHFIMEPVSEYFHASGSNLPEEAEGNKEAESLEWETVSKARDSSGKRSKERPILGSLAPIAGVLEKFPAAVAARALISRCDAMPAATATE